MSAYMCEDVLFDAIASAAARGLHPATVYLKNHVDRVKYGDTRLDARYQAAEMAKLLRDENIRSLEYRYEGRYETDPEYTFTRIPGDRLPSTVALLKACDCLEYQSCENEDYRSTLAFAVLDQIRGKLISELAGYEEAPWGCKLEPATITLSPVKTTSKKRKTA